MKAWIPSMVIVFGVGLLVFGMSGYTPTAEGYAAGWSDDCRYAMALGAMLAVGGIRASG
jgi:hypothetical protein